MLQVILMIVGGGGLLLALRLIQSGKLGGARRLIVPQGEDPLPWLASYREGAWYKRVPKGLWILIGFLVGSGWLAGIVLILKHFK